MKGPCSLEQIARAIAERILDDWASLSCSGRSGKGNEMLPPSLDVLLAARRSSSDMPVRVVDILATLAFLVGPMILLPEEVLPTQRPLTVFIKAFTTIQLDYQSRHGKWTYGHILMLIHYNGQ